MKCGFVYTYEKCHKMLGVRELKLQSKNGVCPSFYSMLVNSVAVVGKQLEIVILNNFYDQTNAKHQKKNDKELQLQASKKLKSIVGFYHFFVLLWGYW